MSCDFFFLPTKLIHKNLHIYEDIYVFFFMAVNYMCYYVTNYVRIDATANTVFLHRGRAFLTKTTKTVHKQASGSHTNTLGREIKSPIQMTDFELMTYT